MHFFVVYRVNIDNSTFFVCVRIISSLIWSIERCWMHTVCSRLRRAGCLGDWFHSCRSCFLPYVGCAFVYLLWVSNSKWKKKKKPTPPKKKKNPHKPLLLMLWMRRHFKSWCEILQCPCYYILSTVFCFIGWFRGAYIWTVLNCCLAVYSEI